MTKTEEKLKKQKEEADKRIAKIKKSGRELTDEELLDYSYAGVPTIEDLFFGKEELVAGQKQLFKDRKVNKFDQAVFFRFQEKMLTKYGTVRMKLSDLSGKELIELSDVLNSVKLHGLQHDIMGELLSRLPDDEA